MNPLAIRVSRLNKRFGDFNAVAGVEFAAPQGAFLVLLGPSGCGKTTLLRMLAGLEIPSGGEIWFGDRLVASGERGLIVPPAQRNAGLVFQSYALWPHMTVRGNIEWPLKVAHWAPTLRQARAREVLEFLGIYSLAERYPNEISGGEQQRVAIARMLAPKPTILLFDEPLSNLDAKLRVEMRAELSRIHRATGATSVYVTHDQVEAMTMASHVAVLKNGRIEQFGSPQEVLDSPNTAFVAGFVGTPPNNLLSAVAAENRFRFGPVDLAASQVDESNQRWWLAYRPEDVRVHVEPGENRLPVEFAEATPIAGRLIVTGWFEQQRLTAVVDRMPAAQLGNQLYFQFPAAPCAIYDTQGRRVPR